jgi:hypothetical protein
LLFLQISPKTLPTHEILFFFSAPALRNGARKIEPDGVKISQALLPLAGAVALNPLMQMEWRR